VYKDAALIAIKVTLAAFAVYPDPLNTGDAVMDYAHAQ
jgi:hypothetical protein